MASQAQQPYQDQDQQQQQQQHPAASFTTAAATESTINSPSFLDQQQLHFILNSNNANISQEQPQQPHQHQQKQQHQHQHDQATMESSRSCALAQILDALAGLRDKDGDGNSAAVDSSAFRQAVMDVPELVELESDPLRFLRRENNDVPKAAKRLSLYWNFRKEVFGDRAFRPITLTGEGAMEPSDIAVFRQGYQIPLPPMSSGHSVMFSDKIALYQFPPHVRRRCAFYSFHVVSENELSITEGFVAATLFGDMAAATSTVATAALATDGIASKVRANHIFAKPVDDDKLSQNNFFANFASIMLKMLGMEVSQKTLLHITTTPEDNRAKCLSLGFEEDKISPALGGTWGPEQLSNWIDHRIAMEKTKYAFWTNQHGQGNNVSRSFYGSDPSTQLQLQLRDSTLEALQQQHFMQTLRTGTFATGNNNNNNSDPTGLTCSQTDFLSEQYLAVNRDVPGSPKLAPRMPQEQQPKISMQRPNNSPPRPQSGLSALTEAAFHMPAVATATSITSPASAPSVPTATVAASDEEYRRLGIERNCPVHETDEIRRAAIFAMDEALKTISFQDKAAYLEALQTCPDLVMTESDMMRFARVTNYDAMTAARRLVEYWQHRKDLFGERAFLPMTQTGHGALDRDDIVVLSCGKLAVTRCDVSGRSIVVGDRTRLIDRGDASLMPRLRATFYLLSVLSEEEINQTEGIVWITCLVSPRVTTGYNKGAATGISEAIVRMPIKVKAVHIVVIPPKTGKKDEVAGLTDKVRAVLMKNEFTARHTGIMLIHKRATEDEIAAVLKTFGIPPECVPKSCGGSWKYEEFTKWQRRRGQFEQSVRRLDTGHTQPKNPGIATDDKTLTDAEKKERKRQLNVIHSRQKRERRKAEAEELQAQVAVLEKQNKALQCENARLEGLWAESKQRAAMMDQVSEGTAPAQLPQETLGRGTSDFQQKLLASQLLLNHAIGRGSTSAPAFPPVGASVNGTQHLFTLNRYDPSAAALGLSPNFSLPGSMLHDHALRSGVLPTLFANPLSLPLYPPRGNPGGSSAASFLMNNYPQFQQIQQQLQQQQQVQSLPPPPTPSMHNVDFSMFMPGIDGVDK